MIDRSQTHAHHLETSTDAACCHWHDIQIVWQSRICRFHDFRCWFEADYRKMLERVYIRQDTGPVYIYIQLLDRLCNSLRKWQQKKVASCRHAAAGRNSHGAAEHAKQTEEPSTWQELRMSSKQNRATHQNLPGAATITHPLRLPHAPLCSLPAPQVPCCCPAGAACCPCGRP